MQGLQRLDLMDILFNKASRQLGSIRNDIDRLSELSASGNPGLATQQGQFMASLTTLNKTLNDLEEIVKREMSMEKRSSYKERLAMLRSEHEAVKTRFNEIKQAQRERERQQNRSDLFRGPASAGEYGRTPDSQSSQQQLTEALLKEREGRTLDYAGTRLDEIIAMGQGALEGVRNQRGSLKSAHRRVLDAATTLGLSKNVIRVIEQKSAQDKFIFWGGVIVTFLVVYMMWRYLSGA